MTDQAKNQAVLAAGEIGETPQAMKKKKAAKRRRKRIIKNLFVLLILAGIGYGGYLGFQKLFAEDESAVQALTDFTYRGSITTRISGGGVTKPLSSEAVIAGFKCKIEEVLTPAGTNVFIGDALYTINTDEVAKELEAASKVLEGYQKDYENALKQPDSLRAQIAAINEKIAALSVYAPFDGKIINASAKKGNNIGEGAQICQLVNDRTMLLTQYFSYAYADEIKVGGKANVSIPSTMSNVEGRVKEVVMVERISAEGTKLFEVVVEITNPGTLTSGVLATAAIPLGENYNATPYEAAELQYCEIRDIYTEAGGTVISADLRNYAVVKAGDKLLAMENERYAEDIAQLEQQIADIMANMGTYEERIAAQEVIIADLNDKLTNNVVYSEVNGMVSSVMIIGGQTVEPGFQVMTISDSSMMTIDARIDSLNISDVSVGAEVMLTQYGMDYNIEHIGTIADISLEGRYENNYSYFPAIIQVDNAEGNMLSGTYVQYDIIANESLDCVVAPAQCVKSTDMGTVVFVKSETAPENAVELGEGVEVPEGFWPVVVKTGLSDNYSVEIIEGVDEQTELFLQYMTDSGSSWDMGGGIAVGW